MSERLAASSVSWTDPSRAFHALMRVAISDTFHEILMNQRVPETDADPDLPDNLGQLRMGEILS